MDSSEDVTYTLKDLRPVHDPIFPYPDEIRDKNIPLIIDNGSYHCRAGWATEPKPQLIFKNVVAKQRGKKEFEAQIGNDISNIEVVRWLLKTQFDRNVVTQFDVQEQIFDYIFTHLGINTEGCVNHPIVITEALANPNYSRQLMSELLFECYHVPKVCYGVDSLFSYHLNNQNKGNNGLIISCGYHTTHVIPVINRKIDGLKMKQISVGGSHITNFLHRLLQLKYPAHFAAVTLSRAEEIVHNHTFVAEDYQDSICIWEDQDYYEANVHKIQLPYTPLPGNTTSSEAQKERKQQQIKRLQEMNTKRREERLAADEEKLQQLTVVQELLEEEDEDTFNRALEDLGYSSAAELQAAISQLNARIQKTKEKNLNVGKEDDSPQEPKPKRLCEEMESKPPAELEAWLISLKQKRQELLDSRAQRRQRKSDMAKRRTLASQERMKIISQLAAEKKKEDNFGQNDDDWEVYKAINKEGGDTDSEEEQEKLQEIEQLLRENDPEFEKEMAPNELNFSFNLAEYYQLHLDTERIRGPELLFQPSMMGIEQAGIPETIDFIMKQYDKELQNQIVQNIFLTGGCSQFPGFISRLQRELLSIRPFQSTFHITQAADPVFDAWNGARKWSLELDNIERYGITKMDYDEKGGEYLIEHDCSNLFFPTPPSVAKPTPPAAATVTATAGPSTTQ